MRVQIAAPRRMPVAARPVQCFAKPQVSMKDALAMTPEQIDDKVFQIQREMIGLRMKVQQKIKVDSAKFRVSRKDIARLLTAKRQQEIDQGVTKRESRKRATKAAVAKGMAL